jgi:dephospho-CoA kinase
MGGRALLTGGIGSGKSTAAGVFTALGARVVSADEAGHRVLEPGGAAERRVAERWPGAVRSGRIDREILGGIVFSDPAQRRELEAITHPAIRELVSAEVAAATGPLVLLEVPLPVDPLGSGWPRIVVDAPDRVRTGRLVARGMDPDEIARRMAAQPSREEWLAIADHVLDNGGDLVQLERECRRVWPRVAAGDLPVGG